MKKPSTTSPTPQSAKTAQQQLAKFASPENAARAMQYFKTAPGDYGEGDSFLGIRMPQIRQCVKDFASLPLPDLDTLLQSSWHEERMLALLILVRQVGHKKHPLDPQLAYDLYLARSRWINNWDLVDSSAPTLLGAFLFTRPRTPLHHLARSNVIWERRMAIIATQYFIRQNDFDETLALCQTLLHDSHDLIHKACGWMLREIGQRNLSPLLAFLDLHAHHMPRTMLRYAIEHLDTPQRKAFLAQRP